MHEKCHEYHTVNHEKRVKLQHITNVQVKCENKKGVSTIKCIPRRYWAILPISGDRRARLEIMRQGK